MIEKYAMIKKVAFVVIIAVLTLLLFMLFI